MNASIFKINEGMVWKIIAGIFLAVIFVSYQGWSDRSESLGPGDKFYKLSEEISKKSTIDEVFPILICENVLYEVLFSQRKYKISLIKFNYILIIFSDKKNNFKIIFDDNGFIKK